MAENPKQFVVNSWTDIFGSIIDPSQIKSVETYGNGLRVTCYDGMVIKIKNGAVAYKSHLLSALYGEVKGVPYRDFLEATEKLTIKQLEKLIDETRGLPDEVVVREFEPFFKKIELRDIPYHLRNSMGENDKNSVNINQLLEEKRLEDRLRTEDDVYQELFEKGRKLRL